MSDLGLLNYEWSLTFLTQLNRLGVVDCIISPGSRSTPLVLAATQLSQLKKRVVIDERSAAFQALGIAKATASPVLLICTSGTATANYYPAIVEAAIARVPLLIITADRPTKLRQIGSQQTIDQIKLYGNHAEFFDLGEPNPNDIKRLPILATQVFFKTLTGRPVHINAPFRKPLEPKAFELNPLEIHPAEVHISFPNVDLTDLQNELSVSQRPLFIFGPVAIPSLNFTSVFKWALSQRIPCISEVLSQNSNTVGLFEPVLRNNEYGEYFQPDLLVRFGRQPVSSGIEQYLTRNSDIPQLHFDYFDVWHDATFSTSHHYFGKIDEDELHNLSIQFDETWSERWNNLAQERKTHITSILEAFSSFSDAHVFESISKWNQFEGLHISNSYPIRDIELFSQLKDKQFFCNRGANGIDGVLSTALGNSVACETFCTVIGDIAFLHDATSLVNHVQYKSQHTIVVIQNGGGRIFDMLPVAQAASEVLKEYFTTPQSYSVEFIAKTFGISYAKVTTKQELEQQLSTNFERIRIIECITDNEESKRLRKSATAG